MSDKVPKGWKRVKLTRNKLTKFCLSITNEFLKQWVKNYNRFAIARIYLQFEVPCVVFRVKFS